MTLHDLISDNYDIQITDLTLLDQYFGTEIYLAQTLNKHYIIKKLPPAVPNLENEEPLTRFLAQNGIPVARLLLTKNGEGCVKTEQTQFHVQEFIEGKTFRVNTAPLWLMDGSARLLGQIDYVLKSYGKMNVNFGKEFFTPSNANASTKYYIQQLAAAVEEKNIPLTSALEERIKHLERISTFNIDAEKLTYTNSHGDFYIGQLIVNDRHVTVIDWTGACKLPAALEVMMSYVYAAPECKDGKISSDRLKRYIDYYSEYFHLNDYDIKIMPYLFYYQQIMCHYSPPYDDIPDTYKPVCNLINNFTKWLYENAENLERALQK